MGPSDVVQNKDMFVSKVSETPLYSPINSPQHISGSPKFSIASSLSDPDIRKTNKKVTSNVSLKLPPLLEKNEGNNSLANLNADFRDDKSIQRVESIPKVVFGKRTRSI